MCDVLMCFRCVRCVVVQRDAWDIVEGGLFRNVSRVGDNALRMRGEIAEFKIAHTVHDEYVCHPLTHI